MRNFWTICIGLTLVAALCLAVGFALPAILLFPMAVAWYYANRQFSHVRGLLVAALAAPMLMSGSYMIAGVFFTAALLGLLLGWMMQKNVSLGQAVAVMTLCVFTLLAVPTAFTWQESRDDWSAMILGFAEKSWAGNMTDAGNEYLTFFQWLDERWAFVAFGILFGSILMIMVLMCSVLYRALAAKGNIRPANSHFTRMRAPEHLVWLAILLAGLWFLDRQWPSEPLRFVAWNGAIATAVVYWLNGLSLAINILQTFGVRLIWIYALLFTVFAFQVHQIFAVIGLFDTWADFRLKAARAMAARQARDKNAEND